MEKKKINTDPMEQAYKQLDGEPAPDAVSQAAMGNNPQTAYAENEQANTDKEERLEGEDPVETQDPSCTSQDLEDAFAQLFGALSVIMKSK